MAWIDPTPVAQNDVLTSAKWNQDVVANTEALSRGVLAQTQSTTAQTITAADTPLTGLTLSGLTLLPGRRYRFRCQVNVYGTGGTAGALLKVQLDAANNVAVSSHWISNGVMETTCICEGVVTISGQSELRVVCSPASGATVERTGATATVWVEDVGPA